MTNDKETRNIRKANTSYIAKSDVSREDVDRLVRDALRGVAQELGRQGYPLTSIFYSNPFLTLSPGNFYIAGINPAVGENDHSQTFEELLSLGHDTPWTKYLPNYERWPGSGRNVQLRFEQLAKEVLPLGSAGLLETFSTNVMFAKTPGQDDIVSPHAVFEACWMWHQRFLDLIRPRWILIMGNGGSPLDRGRPSAFGLVAQRLQSRQDLGQYPVQKRGFLKAMAGTLPGLKQSHDVIILGLPHRYFPQSPPARGTREHWTSFARNSGWLPAFGDDLDTARLRVPKTAT